MAGWLQVMLLVLGLLGVPAALLVCLYIWNIARLTRVKTAAFHDRTPLNCPQILREHFSELPNSEDEFAKVWLCLGSALCIDPKYLRPDDRLDDARMVTAADAHYEIEMIEQLRDLIVENRTIILKLDPPKNLPATVREIVYLCLGRDDLLQV